MLIKNIDSLIIVSPFGTRTREGMEEFHPGIDIRVVDAEWNPHDILTPEQMFITSVVFSAKWGHAIFAKVFEQNDLGIDEFIFWHIKPHEDCVESAVFLEGQDLGKPESGYVALHLHFGTRAKGKPVDPLGYLEMRGQKYEVKVS